MASCHYFCGNPGTIKRLNKVYHIEEELGGFWGRVWIPGSRGGGRGEQEAQSIWKNRDLSPRKHSTSEEGGLGGESCVGACERWAPEPRRESTRKPR